MYKKGNWVSFRIFSLKQKENSFLRGLAFKALGERILWYILNVRCTILVHFECSWYVVYDGSSFQHGPLGT